ncbi:probable serine/threonine-protein kinase PIX13 [Prosopis cineraria]|uniref:probable serine/threonine-protein kinase PIX13 n=1 Tax=Prosopis cineraria TaxID=364024 RepID=UPI00241025F0|nr:probable serine/threonine-protein kinase PIX13 [Prosopis cineraria]
MGLCFCSLAHRGLEISPKRPHDSGSATPESRNVDSFTTNSTVEKSQFSMIASGSVDETNASPNRHVIETPTHLKVFTFGNLKAATKNFKSDSLLGEGGFGKVYKGWLDERTLSPAKAGSGMMVAIKKLNPESMQGCQEWQSEVNFLGGLSHPNLVKLFGYCREDDELLLVYEFMPKGSLESHLFIRIPNVEPLSWNTRLKIAIDAAEGLAFLHTSEKQIIYRDFKASNILLDGSFKAKISDFGLAKLGPTGEQSHVTTRIMGTYGYAAPEYVATGHLYVKSDVYGFGVVLLEMLTGQKALDSKRPSGQHNLVEWVKPCLSSKKKLKTIMDARIEGQYSLNAAFQAAQLILKCVESDPKNRPAMKDVVETLQDIGVTQNKSKGSNKCSQSSPRRHHKKPNHHRSVHDGHKIVDL